MRVQSICITRSEAARKGRGVASMRCASHCAQLSLSLSLPPSCGRASWVHTHACAHRNKRAAPPRALKHKHTVHSPGVREREREGEEDGEGGREREGEREGESEGERGREGRGGGVGGRTGGREGESCAKWAAHRARRVASTAAATIMESWL